MTPLIFVRQNNSKSLNKMKNARRTDEGTIKNQQKTNDYKKLQENKKEKEIDKHKSKRDLYVEI